MSALFSSPSTPKIPAMAPAAKQADESAGNAANSERIRRLMAYGKDQTMLTPSNMGAAPVQRRTLLGSAS